MFGPNTHLSAHVLIKGSHRDKLAEAQIQRLRELFHQKFHLEDYELAFLLGGGSLGVEALIHSSKGPVEVLGTEGTFTRRWKDLASQYNKEKKGAPELRLYCQLETSISKFQQFDGGSVDAVSSFPYVSVPTDAPAFVVSSNKQLGSMVGLTIVGVKRELRDELLRDDDQSYLSLRRHLRSLERNQSPSTLPTHNVDDLILRLERLDLEELRDRIDRISGLIVERLGSDNLIGCTSGPVLTIKKSAVPRSVAEKWELYEKPLFGGVYQIFTYSCAPEHYSEFLAEIREE